MRGESRDCWGGQAAGRSKTAVTYGKSLPHCGFLGCLLCCLVLNPHQQKKLRVSAAAPSPFPPFLKEFGDAHPQLHPPRQTIPRRTLQQCNGFSEPLEGTLPRGSQPRLVCWLESLWILPSLPRGARGCPVHIAPQAPAGFSFLGGLGAGQGRPDATSLLFCLKACSFFSKIGSTGS